MRVLYTQCTFNIYSAFFFVHFIYPPHSTCSWIILSTANIVICIRSFLLLFSVKTSCNLTFFRALAFFLSEVTNSVVQSGCFFVSTNLFLRSTLSCTYQGSLSIHSHLLISSFQVPILCFFSLEPSLLIILLAFFRDRFVYQRFMSPSTAASPVFFQFA